MVRLKFVVCDLCLPLLQLLPAGRVRALGWLGGGNQQDADWADVYRRHRVFYDRDMGAWVYVDLADWGGRWHYYSGHYYDRTTRALIHRLLRAGDSYVDVGANLGMHVVPASRQVGPSGVVVAIEPNPSLFRVLSAHMAINEVQNARLFNVGLSDEAGELQLHWAGHEGAHTFRPVEGATRSTTVPVRVADDLLADVHFPGRVLVKIDTEGFEHHVLRGMRKLRHRDDTYFVVEVNDEWLRATGSGAAGLFEDMAGDGYKPYQVFAGDRGRRTILLRPIDKAPMEGLVDIVFSRVPLDA